MNSPEDSEKFSKTLNSSSAFNKWNGKTVRLKKSKSHFVNKDLMYQKYGGTNLGNSIDTDCYRNRSKDDNKYFFTEIDKVLDIYTNILRGDNRIVVKNMQPLELSQLFYKYGTLNNKKYIRNRKVMCSKFNVPANHSIIITKNDKIIEECMDELDEKIMFEYTLCEICDSSFYHDSSHPFPYSIYKQDMRWSPEWWFWASGHSEIYDELVSQKNNNQNKPKILKNEKIADDIEQQLDLYLHKEDTNNIIYNLYNIDYE